MKKSENKPKVPRKPRAKKEKVGLGQAEKTAFRKSKPWKGFRSDLKEERQVDELTLMKLTPRFNLHHKDMSNEHYTDISNKDHFACLNKASHDTVHRFFTQFKKKKIGGARYLERFLRLMLQMAKLNCSKEDYDEIVESFKDFDPNKIIKDLETFN